jgi:CBS domain containing-hemolysin-like protein
VSEPVALLVALVLLALNAFFVGAEFALISARRTQIEPRAAAGSAMARTTLDAMENVSLVMAGAQLGITICSLGLGAVGEPAVAHLLKPVFHAAQVPDQLLHPVAFVVAMAIVVYLHVVLGEMVPKNVALAGPDRAALVLGPPMMWIVRVLHPVIIALNMIANATVRLFGIDPRDEVSSAFTRDEVAAMVNESRGEGAIKEDEYVRLAGALGFTERTVTSVLLQIDDLATLSPDATPRDVEELCASTGYSRFPIRRPTTPGPAGYVHIKDVLHHDNQRSRDQPLATTLIRPFATVRAEEPLHLALERLQHQGAHMAQVIDDNSAAVLGLVTLEDVLEELVGEIRDAAHHDEPGQAQA